MFAIIIFEYFWVGNNLTTMVKFYMKQILLIIFFGLILTNCTVKYKVVGKYEEFNEVFIGTVNSDLMSGTAVIEVETVPSKMKCSGNSRINFIPASNYLIPGYCKGQKGIATLMCSLTGRVEGTFTTKSCTKGYGTGFDKEGRMFAFTFGFSEEDAKIEIDRLMAEVKNKPDLPIYEPEKVRKEKGFSTGTGFFISNEGHMITNYHVIRNANNITVSVDDKELIAKVIAQDKVNDIAIIKIDDVENISALPIIKAKNSDVGEEVFTLGYPLVDVQGKELKATFGRINAMSGLEDDVRLMQIDVPIQPGNSGGPLINSKGEVIGIVTATLDSIVTLYKKGVLPQNVNFAVKSDYIFPVLENITSENKSNSKKEFSAWVKKYRNSVKMVIAR